MEVADHVEEAVSDAKTTPKMMLGWRVDPVAESLNEFGSIEDDIEVVPDAAEDHVSDDEGADGDVEARMLRRGRDRGGCSGGGFREC